MEPSLCRLLVLAVLAGRIILMGRAGGEEADAEGDSCLVSRSENCFREVMPTLNQELSPGRLGADFCSVLDDALQCASDIIDDATCKDQDGQLNFDNWMSGLTAVKQKLCGDNYSLLTEFLLQPCFSIDDFLECVEQFTQVSHVTDLLKVILDDKECRKVLVSLVTCNVRASPAHSSCYESQEIINSILNTFFDNTKCGPINTTTTLRPRPTSPSTYAASANHNQHKLFSAATTSSPDLLAVLLPPVLYVRTLYSH